MPGTNELPVVGFHFSLELQGKVTGYFTECSGIGSEHEVVEHKVVTPDGHQKVMKIPGRLKWGDITLKKGVTSSMEIWEWRKKVEDGQVDAARCNGSITMFDQRLTPVAQWDFEGAWPTKVSGPTPKADGNEVGLEELTIAHEYIKRVK
jgi:phage tail-like protein